MQGTGVQNPLDGHTFSYISKNEFDSIFKQVRRERRKRHEEKVWERYLMKKQEIRASPQPGSTAEETNQAIQEKVEVDACKYCPKSDAIGIVQKVDGVPLRLVHDLKPSPEPGSDQFLNTQRQECSCCHLELSSPHCGGTNEFPVQPKAPSLENKLYEITNFDQDFKRVEELRDKIVFTLKNVDAALHQDWKCLDDEETQRNKVRTAEFASRFKRNYHYQITRAVNEIQKLNSNESGKKMNVPAAVKKFKASHQAAVQALQAVEKHFRTNNDRSCHVWLQEFLTSVCEMERLFASVFHSNIVEEDTPLKTVCSNIVVTLESTVNKHKRQPEVKKKCKPKRTPKRNKTKDNLWMYRNHNDWKTKASELARLRLVKLNKKKVEPSNVDQRDDKSTTVPENLPDVKMTVKQREGAALRKQVRYVKEDQVRTMMEIVPDATDSDREDDEGDVLCKETNFAVPNSKGDRTIGGKKESLQSTGVAPSNSGDRNSYSAPTNVGFVCFKREEDDAMPSKSNRSPTECENSQSQVKKATQYRRALQSYQRTQKWYDPNIIDSIDKMTEQIYEELIGNVASDINIDHIISDLIELEVRR